MITWSVRCMNTVSPYDIKMRSVVADSAADAMVISDREDDDYLAVSARFLPGEQNERNSTATQLAGEEIPQSAD